MSDLKEDEENVLQLTFENINKEEVPVLEAEDLETIKVK